MNIMITKTDGTKEPFNADRINRSIERACKGLEDPIGKVTQVASETQLTLYDGINTEELDEATINAAVQNIKDDIHYDKIATRLLLKTVYRRVLGEHGGDDQEALKMRHAERFITYIKEGVAAGLLDARMVDVFDLEELSKTLDISRDELFGYAGLSGLLDRYAIKNTKQKPQETPQYFFMRIAMGLSFNEKNPTEWAKKFYHKMSRHEYIAGGSTNVNAGTATPALSNCFLIQMEDDMGHIAKTVSDVMMISKATGGIGVSVTKLRATGSALKSSNTVSSGPTTFAKIMDVAIRAIQRGGKKKGALAFYMENWHLDYTEFMDWKHNAGDDHVRMRTANTAVFITDEFMQRVERNDSWYFFDPKETPDLVELYGKAFSKRYTEYCDMADRGEMKMFKKTQAREVYRQTLVAMQTTSHPWLTWKDPINVRALNNNTGTIHMSNLCTEICLPQDKDNIAVCNLASINLSAHIREKEVLWGKLEETVRMGVRHLDNLVDINALPVEQAKNSDLANRAIGLGMMGFADAIEKLGMAYDSEHAWDFADRIFEFISYMAIDESANLARERGSYPNFEGSRWSEGMVPIDTLRILEEERGERLMVPKESRHKGLNWDVLRSKVKKGMRNATLMAVAPNANIGLLVGTTPGIDARFAQVFSRNKFSGKYLDINHNLVKDLKNMGIWEDVKDEIVAHHGDLTNIEGIPAHIKNIYKTSFTTSPYAYINVAARAQKWVDQALSRNMYLRSRDIDETMKVYQTAWKLGVKTTYYLHMEPRHTAEQSTIKVNKSSSLLGGRKGFAALRKTKVTETREAVSVEEETAVAFSDASTEAVVVEEETAVAFSDASTEAVVVESNQNTEMTTREVVAETESASVESTAKPVGFAAVKKVSERAHGEPAAPEEKTLSSKGFGALKSTGQKQYASLESLKETVQEKQETMAPKSTSEKAANTCPVDPAERAQCDSCQ